MSIDYSLIRSQTRRHFLERCQLGLAGMFLAGLAEGSQAAETTKFCFKPRFGFGHASSTKHLASMSNRPARLSSSSSHIPAPMKIWSASVLD